MFISQDWETLLYGHSTNVYPAIESYIAKFVSKQDSTKERDDFWEGQTDEVWVIFEVDGKYYKKFGEKDSYGEYTWTGKCVQVEKKTKTIEVYE